MIDSLGTDQGTVLTNRSADLVDATDEKRENYFRSTNFCLNM